jgi:hypothetical protein
MKGLAKVRLFFYALCASAILFGNAWLDCQSNKYRSYDSKFLKPYRTGCRVKGLIDAINYMLMGALRRPLSRYARHNAGISLPS